jgi:N utilization substance protein B
MANRHLSRSIVLQTLYEWDFLKKDLPDLSDMLKRNVEEFSQDGGDIDFMAKLLAGIISKRDELDKIIVKAAPEWPIEKIALIDRNVLRIGLYELLFSARDEVPPKVAINEAIELAKAYSGEISGKFVNGVLGAVYKELGEPGKDNISNRKLAKQQKKEIPLEDLPIQRLGGAIVYAKDGANIYLALVHDVFGHWTLSKGKILPDEDLKLGTARKVKEEIGLDIEIRAELGSNEYVASQPEIGKVRKQVNYFLAESKFDELKFQKTGGLDDANWFKVTDILDLNLYDDLVPFFTKTINILLAEK